jgi:pantothenate kinase
VAELSAVIHYVRARAESEGRTILGIVGPPGVGKSTLAAALVEAAGERARMVPMDGFHLAQCELERLGLSPVKGAPETFDPHGYVNLLARIRRRDEPVVYAPTFDRRLEQAVAGAIAIPAEVSLIVTEGNYLLLPGHPWASIRDLLDESWYLELRAEQRLERLIKRHVSHGFSLEAAEEKALGCDHNNAEIVRSTRIYASQVINVEELQDARHYA